MPLALSRRITQEDEEKLVRMDMDENSGSTYSSKEKTVLRYKRAVIALVVIIVVCSIVILALGVALSKTGNSDNTSSSSTNPVYAQLYSNITSCLDTTVKPCDDFYEYACGTWLKNTPIPSDQTVWARSFSVINNDNQQTLKAIQEENWPIIGNFYASCMDMVRVNDTGVPQLVADKLHNASVLNPSSPTDLATFLGQMVPAFTPHGLFNMGVMTDTIDPTKNIIAFGQGGLSLPSKSYYTNAPVVANLSQHIVNMFSLLNLPDHYNGQQIAADSIAFEIKLANISLDPDQLRDPVATYNNRTLAQLNAIAPCFDFKSYLLAYGFPASSISDSTVVTIESPAYFENLCGLLTPNSQYISYLQWRILHSVATVMSQQFYTENFLFFGQYLNGQAAQTPRWKKCVAETDENLGELLGRYFVAQKFAGGSKVIAQDMINNVMNAFATRVNQLDWMDAATKSQALVKLGLVVALIGYPDKWTDYSSLNLCSMDYFGNLIAMWKFSQQQQITKLGQAADKFKWQMTPPTVNAYYDPSYNTINFPAGIMQGVFFNAEFPSAVNYGALGMVEGHELTHGFDDQGSQYDGHGALRDWWTDGVKTNFQQRASCLVNQYSQFKEGPDFVNGNLTLGENIADNGGIRLAFDAWKLHVAAKGDDTQIDPSITNEQLFFLSFAQSWCKNITPLRAHTLIETDPHSPAKARVNLPLQNYPQFGVTWKCPTGSAMNPADRCVVW